MMRRLAIDIVIGIGLALAVAALVLFSSYNSTFIYRGF
jgi:predicted RND superfamily exporter protein